jgi:hypothetical protein
MSWALLADNDKEVQVTGTLITTANGKEALEVILALSTVKSKDTILKETIA